nr:MAG TPA: hypothetical protein [Caudoviricetes sp.]
MSGILNAPVLTRFGGFFVVVDKLAFCVLF